MALFKFFTFLTGRLLERGPDFEILKNRNSDFQMRFKIKYPPFIFEKYRILMNTQNETASESAF